MLGCVLLILPWNVDRLSLPESPVSGAPDTACYYRVRAKAKPGYRWSVDRCQGCDTKWAGPWGMAFPLSRSGTAGFASDRFSQQPSRRVWSQHHGGISHPENLQLLCGARTRVPGQGCPGHGILKGKLALVRPSCLRPKHGRPFLLECLELGGCRRHDRFRYLPSGHRADTVWVAGADHQAQRPIRTPEVVAAFADTKRDTDVPEAEDRREMRDLRPAPRRCRAVPVFPNKLGPRTLVPPAQSDPGADGVCGPPRAGVVRVLVGVPISRLFFSWRAVSATGSRLCPW